ncbi:phage tail protein, partial [Weissella cibaria]
MLKFRDPQSNIQLAEAELTYKEAVNGEKSLTGTIYSNDDVLHQMERGWSVMFNGDWYYITYVAPTDGGNSITVEFDAVHEFFFKMSKSVAYGTLKDGSHTAKEYLDFVFNGSGYSYTLLSQVDAWEKQSFGDKNRLALFNDLISDMEMEFSIADSGRIMITSEIGQDLSTIVRKGFNLQELNLEYNVSDFVTYAKGFGAFIDKDDESKGRYEAEYTSPLASVYGKLEADPITDERYTKTASLQAALKKAVDSSYSISVGISLEELQNAGYDYESPVQGDYILAVDEQLDFNQRIRIISVEEQYNIYGERISSSVEAGSISATKQKLDGSESNSVVLALSHATEQADNAVKTANGKNTSYSGPNQPQNPREGDMWWYDNGSGTSFMKQYTNGEWVILVDSNTKQNIENAVDNAIDTSKSYADDLNDKQTTLTNSLASDVQKKADSLSANQQSIASQASKYTDSALAQANANAQQIGQTTAQNAQKALDNAKSDLSNSIASEASARDKAVSSANSQAQAYANQAKSDAITAATTADGVIKKDFKETTDGLSSTITQNKQTADDGISTAQTTAQQAVDGLKTKVSQTDYNAKTGQLQTDLTATTQTANQARTDIVSIKQKDGEQDAKMNTIISDANGTKQTVSDLKTEQGKQSGSISKLEQRADGFDATVTKVNNLAVGGRNYVLDSDVLTSSNITNFKTSIPVSGFSGKKIVISVQVDYDNITGFNNQSPFHRVMFEPTFIDKRTGRTI